MKMVVKDMMNQWSVVSGQWAVLVGRYFTRNFSGLFWPLVTGHWSLSYVSSSHNRLDVSANVEVSFNLNAQRVTGADKVLENHVDDVFMKDLHLSKRIDVELETLKFNAPLMRNILKADGGKVWKIGKGTDGSELGDLEIDFYLASGKLISESVEREQIHLFARRRTHVQFLLINWL